MTPVAMKSVALSEVARLLASNGFRKRAGEIFTLDLATCVLGWVGLNRASKHHPAGEFSINPVVGVRHQEVERLVAELRGDKLHGYVPPTLSIPLGQLMPGASFRQWSFSKVASDEAARDMVDAIVTYAVPFIRRSSVLLRICEELMQPGLEHQLIYRRPIAWMLLGERSRSREVLEASLAKIGDRQDLAAHEFRRFAQALAQRLSTD
jgi:hypothetical protein